MSRDAFRCALCGFAFDPAANAACHQCPLIKNCPMVCCPACGHSTIDPARSKLGRLAQFLLAPKVRAESPSHPGQDTPLCTPLLTLAQVPVGAAVRVVSLESGLGAKVLQLQAYGLAPGRLIRVVQQRPVTVVQADHTELALEADLAAGVLVEVAG